MSNEIYITKASGESVVYDESKLRHSLKRSKSPEILIEEILKVVRVALYDGITTQEIYKMAFEKLKKKARPVAGRYKLKKAKR